jgi:hypothetical protein
MLAHKVPKCFFYKFEQVDLCKFWINYMHKGWGHIFLVSHPNAVIQMAAGATRDGPQLLFGHNVQKDHDQRTTPFSVLQYSMTSLSTLGSGNTLLCTLWLQVLKHWSWQIRCAKIKAQPKVNLEQPKFCASWFSKLHKDHHGIF